MRDRTGRFVKPEPPEVWDGSFAVYRADMSYGWSADGRRWMLGYDDTVDNPGGVVCNLLGGDATICRLWRTHVQEGIPHMAFTVDLVVQSGIFCLGVESPPFANTPDSAEELQGD